jgi:hypothetical protein
MMRVIDVTVSPTGQTTVATKGFIGSGCREASRFLEEALGKCRSDRLTPEFHQATTEQAAQAQHLNSADDSRRDT